MSTNRNHRPTDRRRGMLAVVALGCLALALTMAAVAPAQDLQSRLDDKQAELDQQQSQEGVLSTTIERYSGQIDQLTGEVATLRNREAAVQEQLDQTQARLDSQRAHLNVLRQRFARSLRILKSRLVSIYKSDQPDALTVILQSDGFDDLLERYQYLTSIEEQDAALVGRVRTLRTETRDTVEEVRGARDEIAARKAELERTRAQLEAREADLSVARSNKQGALQDTRTNIERLEGDIGDIQGQIQAQIQAAQQAAAPLPGRADPGRVLERAHLAGQRPGDLAVRLALGPDARGHRHRRSQRHTGPGRRLRTGDPGRPDQRLRQLHVRRPRRRALHLLRPPVFVRSVDGPERAAGPGDRLLRLHRQLLRRPPALRGPGQRQRRGPDGLPLGGNHLETALEPAQGDAVKLRVVLGRAVVATRQHDQLARFGGSLVEPA